MYIPTGVGADYVIVEQELGPFGPSEQHCLHVLLIQDGICEGTMTESFKVQLMNTDDTTKVIDTASVLIYDASTCSKYRVWLLSLLVQLSTNCLYALSCLSISLSACLSSFFLYIVLIYLIFHVS